jgi:hypothetical protein
MDDIADMASMHRCALEQCHCLVPLTEEYCSDYCSDADDVAEIVLECCCGHPSCQLE